MTSEIFDLGDGSVAPEPAIVAAVVASLLPGSVIHGEWFQTTLGPVIRSPGEWPALLISVRQHESAPAPPIWAAGEAGQPIVPLNDEAAQLSRATLVDPALKKRLEELSTNEDFAFVVEGTAEYSVAKRGSGRARTEMTVVDLFSVGFAPRTDPVVQRVLTTVRHDRRTELDGWLVGDIGPEASDIDAVALVAANPVEGFAEPPLWGVAATDPEVFPLNDAAEAVSSAAATGSMRDARSAVKHHEYFPDLSKSILATVEEQ